MFAKVRSLRPEPLWFLGQRVLFFVRSRYHPVVKLREKKGNKKISKLCWIGLVFAHRDRVLRNEYWRKTNKWKERKNRVTLTTWKYH